MLDSILGEDRPKELGRGDDIFLRDTILFTSQPNEVAKRPSKDNDLQFTLALLAPTEI
jgi:hypothetical protein